MNVVKKILNLILILFGVVLIVFCADLIGNKLYKTDVSDLDETDRAALEELCAMSEVFDDKYGNDEVWTQNYNLRNNPCVITRTFGLLKGSTYAVNMPISKNIFAQRITMSDEYSDIPVYRLSYFYPETFRLAKSENGTFDDVVGKRAYISLFDEQNVKMNGTGSLEECVVETTFKDSVESVDVPKKARYYDFDIRDENVGLFGLQYRIIDDMLGAQNDDKLDEYIAEYVAVREYQAQKYPGTDEYRLDTEISEGCSRFVFYNVSKQIGHNITYFNKEESESITFYSAYYYLCTGRYNNDIKDFLNTTGDIYTGAALCRIIDEHDLIEDWQSRIDGETDTAPYTLLKEYSDKYCQKYSDKSISDIKRIYNYEEIISMARTLCDAIG